MSPDVLRAVVEIIALARFPKCPFVDLAKSKMAALAPPASSFDGVWVAKNVCQRL
jgi:hypothetical protein